MTIPVAVYAPLKNPDHPVPSGDRSMARLLLRALAAAGFAPTVASRLRTFEPAGDAARQAALQEAGRAEASRLLALYRSMPAPLRPRLWFTYHCYYKAPDWTGPVVAEGLGIPYGVAEGSRARKRRDGPWALAHRGAEAALDRANPIFAMTSRDGDALRRDAPPGQRVVDLLPFLDAAAWRGAGPREHPAGGPLRLLAVAMMRSGDKLASYRLLADALTRLADPADSLAGDGVRVPGIEKQDRDGLPPGSRSRPPTRHDQASAWTLDIVGDGPVRPEVEALFAPFGRRVTFLGAIDDPRRLAGLYGDAQLLVWPAVNEAYGMALLEAQAAGCPVLAGRVGGVPDVVVDGVTGVLAPAGDAAAFAAALAGFVAEPGRLGPMAIAAAAFVRNERSLERAATILATSLRPLLARTAAA